MDYFIKRIRKNEINEIKLQKMAYKYGLAPKIHKIYKDGYFIYIVMDNLITLGYKPLSRYLTKNKKIKKILENSVDKLHLVGISHCDLHVDNIFYNETLNKIMFIDFGMSRLCENSSEAYYIDFPIYGRTLENF